MKSLITLVAAPGASKRTKARLQQHGPVFIEKGIQKTFFAEGDWILLESIKTNWTGWLPFEEVKEIKEAEEITEITP